MAAGDITKTGRVNNDIYDRLGERWALQPGRLWGRTPLRLSFHSAPGDTRCRFVAPMGRLIYSSLATNLPSVSTISRYRLCFRHYIELDHNFILHLHRSTHS
jgi:hypothetical protein